MERFVASKENNRTGSPFGTKPAPARDVRLPEFKSENTAQPEYGLRERPRAFQNVPQYQPQIIQDSMPPPPLQQQARNSLFSSRGSSTYGAHRNPFEASEIGSLDDSSITNLDLPVPQRLPQKLHFVEPAQQHHQDNQEMYSDGYSQGRSSINGESQYDEDDEEEEHFAQKVDVEDDERKGGMYDIMETAREMYDEGDYPTTSIGEETQTVNDADLVERTGSPALQQPVRHNGPKRLPTQNMKLQHTPTWPPNDVPPTNWPAAKTRVQTHTSFAQRPNPNAVARGLPPNKNVPETVSGVTNALTAKQPRFIKAEHPLPESKRLPKPIVVASAPPPMSPDRDIREQAAEENIDDTFVIDYAEPILFKKPYSDLAKESFDHDPAEPVVPFPDNLMNAALPDRMQYARQKFNHDQKTAFLSSLELEEWEGAGEWFVEKFTDAMKQVISNRREKRQLAARFEDEIRDRDREVARKRARTEQELNSMRSNGQKLLNTPRKGRSTPKRQ
ncbi:hypothetical protein EJ05DRAFT_534465 [Pseudovirgaria hyperparasitica]|uniref:Extracellular mutant protein 11 C-terminal domain-containing protein n=1 Tax=Pseudovirgaria hyperparasitica TaxID=470096 RepID=A0A6A6WLJ5_9PEZI|nr:uncharacterized protein EJ05DRAFT_534465 [Pseudovirgaria hyperparasitica]KAF2763042.1 hypothetical protein EJ05DRAFT_534465 [Pseudovirgaria hyperparasitica]